MKIRAGWEQQPGAERWIGIHPTYPRFKRWAVLMRHASGRLAPQGQRNYWTRKGAERGVRAAEYRQMYSDERRLERGLPLLPGVTFEIFDMNEHPGRAE